MHRSDPDDFRRKRPPLFWWLLANILAIAFAITSWVVCLNLFRDPTNPTSYEWMMKVGRLQPLEAFTSKTAPDPREIKSFQELEAQFQGYRQPELETLNRELKRAYLTNFKKPKYLTYIKGEFRVTAVRELGEDDFLSPGIVVRAQGLARPDAVTDPIPYPVFIECLFPSKDASSESFQVGSTLKLEMLKKQRNCAALLNVSTTNFENRNVLFMTLVPLAATNYTPESGKAFRISPPEMANVKAPLPAFP